MTQSTRPARFRLVVPHPAHGEVHLLHPERHDKAEEAERDLLGALPALEAAAGSHAIASVSVRNDPMDAIEKIILALARHPVAERLHQDLPRRLQHVGVPITTVEDATAWY